MAHTLTLNWGSNLYNLNSGSTKLLEYIPQTPDLSTVDTNSVITSGGERTVTSRRNVTELCRVLITGNSNDALQTAKQTIQRYLTLGERKQKTLAGSPVYVQYKPSGVSDSAFRSEILSGKVELVDRSLDYRWVKGNVTELVISWTRRYFWEATSESQVSLSNSQGNGTSLKIDNNDYTTNENKVNLSASGMYGEIPTPAKITIGHPGVTVSTRNFYIAHSVISGSGWAGHINGEDGTGIYNSASSGTSASSTGGDYIELAYPAGLTSQTQIAKWTLAGSFLDFCRGGNFSILARFENTPSASVYAQFRIMYPITSTLTTLARATEVELAGGGVTSSLFEMGTLRLPPNLINQTGAIDLPLVLLTRAAGAGTLDIDFIYFMPVDTGYRHLKQIGYQWSGGEIIVDEQNRDYFFQATNGTSKIGLLAADGTPIMLYPSENQSINFLVDEANFMDISRDFDIEVSFRERRLSI